MDPINQERLAKIRQEPMTQLGSEWKGRRDRDWGHNCTGVLPAAPSGSQPHVALLFLGGLLFVT